MDSHTPVPADAGTALASWLAGYCQALEGGDRIPSPTIGDIPNWLIGYDVAMRERQEGSNPEDT